MLNSQECSVKYLGNIDIKLFWLYRTDQQWTNWPNRDPEHQQSETQMTSFISVISTPTDSIIRQHTIKVILIGVPWSIRDTFCVTTIARVTIVNVESHFTSKTLKFKMSLTSKFSNQPPHKRRSVCAAWTKLRREWRVNHSISIRGSTESEIMQYGNFFFALKRRTRSTMARGHKTEKSS